MAKTAANVDKFLNNVGSKLENARQKERQRMLELKKEECERLGYPFNNRIDPWDTRYYMNMVKEKDYSVDVEVLKKYFPLTTIKSGILRLYQHLLGLKFERVNNPEVWHEEVEMVSCILFPLLECYYYYCVVLCYLFIILFLYVSSGT
ncbi:unnamed protein product [Trichobilharzia regenti]|nr:unnamed protein product [Trichobilharzia regenti]